MKIKQFVCDQSIENDLGKSENNAEIVISWFEWKWILMKMKIIYFKKNIDKYHLLISGYNHEHI